MGNQVSSFIPDLDIRNSDTQEEFCYSMSSKNPNKSKPISEEFLDIPSKYKNFVLITEGVPDHIRYWPEKQICVCVFTISNPPIPVNYYHFHTFRGYQLVSIHLGKVAYQNMIYYMSMAKYNIPKSDFLKQIINVANFEEGSNDYNNKFDKSIQPKLTISSPKIAKLSVANNNEDENNNNYQNNFEQKENQNYEDHPNQVLDSPPLLSEDSNPDYDYDYNEQQVVISLVSSSSLTASTYNSSDLYPYKKQEQKTNAKPPIKSKAVKSKSPKGKKAAKPKIVRNPSFFDDYNDGYNDNEPDDLEESPISKSKPAKKVKSKPKKKSPKINIIEDRKNDNSGSLMDSDEPVNAQDKRKLDINIIEDRKGEPDNKKRKLDIKIIEDRKGKDVPDNNSKEEPSKRKLDINIIEDRKGKDVPDNNSKEDPAKRKLDISIIEDRKGKDVPDNNSKEDPAKRKLDINIIEDRKGKDVPDNNSKEEPSKRKLDANIVEDRKGKNGDENPEGKADDRRIDINLNEDKKAGKEPNSDDEYYEYSEENPVNKIIDIDIYDDDDENDKNSKPKGKNRKANAGNLDDFHNNPNNQVNPNSPKQNENPYYNNQDPWNMRNVNLPYQPQDNQGNYYNRNRDPYRQNYSPNENSNSPRNGYNYNQYPYAQSPNSNYQPRYFPNQNYNFNQDPYNQNQDPNNRDPYRQNSNKYPSNNSPYQFPYQTRDVNGFPLNQEPTNQPNQFSNYQQDIPPYGQTSQTRPRRAFSDSPVNSDDQNRYNEDDLSKPRKVGAESPAGLENNNQKPSPKSPNGTVKIHYALLSKGDLPSSEMSDEKPKVVVSTDIIEFDSPRKNPVFQISNDNFNYSKDHNETISISNPVVIDFELKQKPSLNLANKVIVDKFRSKKPMVICHMVEISQYRTNTQRDVDLPITPETPNIATQTSKIEGYEYIINPSVFDDPDNRKNHRSHSKHSKHQRHHRRSNSLSYNDAPERNPKNDEDDLSVFDVEVTQNRNLPSKKFLRNREKESDVDVNNAFPNRNNESEAFAPQYKNSRTQVNRNRK